jgi:hypothetical protein
MAYSMGRAAPGMEAAWMGDLAAAADTERSQRPSIIPTTAREPEVRTGERFYIGPRGPTPKEKRETLSGYVTGRSRSLTPLANGASGFGMTVFWAGFCGTVETAP